MLWGFLCSGCALGGFSACSRRRPCRLMGSVLRQLRALNARRDSGCVMPPRRVAGDERSEPPVVPRARMRRLCCGGCCVPVARLVGSLRVRGGVHAALPVRFSPAACFHARRDSGCVMPPRPRGVHSVAFGPHRRRRPAGLGLSGSCDEVPGHKRPLRGRKDSADDRRHPCRLGLDACPWACAYACACVACLAASYAARRRFVSWGSAIGVDSGVVSASVASAGVPVSADSGRGVTS